MISYFRLVKRFRWIIVVCWVVIAVFGVIMMPKFLNSTTSSFTAPSDTPSYHAMRVFDEKFPNSTHSQTMLLYIEGAHITSAPVRHFVLSVIERVRAFKYASLVEEPIESYFTLVDNPKTKLLAGMLVKGDTTLVVFTLRALPLTHASNDLEDLLQNCIKTMPLPGYFVGVTGEGPLFRAAQTDTVRDMARMDTIALPIALAILGWSIGSVTLVIIPMLVTPCALLAMFLCNYPIATVMDFPSFSPSIFMSLTIAMGIDYSLFLLTRFREEVVGGESVDVAVTRMLKFAGKTILVSGTTLALSFIGLVVFPTQFLSTIGIGSAITLVCTLIANLTLSPALILCFPQIFTYNVADSSCWRATQKMLHRVGRKLGISCCTHISDYEYDEVEGEYQTLRVSSGKSAQSDANIVEIRDCDREDELKRQEQSKSVWFRWAKFCERHPLAVVCIVVAVFSPISYQCLYIEKTVDQRQILPRNSPPVKVYDRLAKHWPLGQLQPYRLLVQRRDGASVYESKFFDVGPALIQHLSDVKVSREYEGFNVQSFVSFVWLNQSINWGVAQLCDMNSSLIPQFCPLYEYVRPRYLSTDHTTAIIEIRTPWDPNGDHCESWVKQVRRDVASFANTYKHANEFEYYLDGGGAQVVDAIDEVWRLFPYMIVGTTLVVFILISYVFRSVFVPLRLLVTIFFTLTWIYGAGVLVFQRGIVDDWFPALKDVHAFYWMAPVMSFSVLVGLSLDYDVFLMSRIYEFRQLSFTNNSSIIKGVYHTGRIITSAGVIMIVAFGSLLFSSEMGLNQIGFLLCFAVAVDTFIVRTLLVPSMMFLIGKWNWWPSKMPTPSKDENDFADLSTME